VLSPILALNLVFAGKEAFQHQDRATIWAFVMSLALFIMALLIRTNPLKVQDRLIRLEEQLRMERLLPENLKPRIGELTEKQFVALRFASDGELAGLVERTLNEKLEPKAIKQAIRTWRPDHFRV
jgi:hypothetical protein